MTRWLFRRFTSGPMRDIAQRAKRLTMAQRLDLGRRIKADHRLPLKVRYLLPLVILYVGLPLDLIPDFVPVVGQLDDLVAMVTGSALLFRRNRLVVVEEHLAAVEAGIIGTTVTTDKRRFVPARWRRV